jgi:hypothetical protein
MSLSTQWRFAPLPLLSEYAFSIDVIANSNIDMIYWRGKRGVTAQKISNWKEYKMLTMTMSIKKYQTHPAFIGRRLQPRLGVWNQPRLGVCLGNVVFGFLILLSESSSLASAGFLVDFFAAWGTLQVLE